MIGFDVWLPDGACTCVRRLGKCKPLECLRQAELAIFNAFSTLFQCARRIKHAPQGSKPSGAAVRQRLSLATCGTRGHPRVRDNPRNAAEWRCGLTPTLAYQPRSLAPIIACQSRLSPNPFGTNASEKLNSNFRFHQASPRNHAGWRSSTGALWDGNLGPLSTQSRLALGEPSGCEFFCVLVFGYRLWDSNPHSFELDFESSASTNSAKPACGAARIKQASHLNVKAKNRCLPDTEQHARCGPFLRNRGPRIRSARRPRRGFHASAWSAP